MGLRDLFRTPVTEASEPSIPLSEHAALSNELELVKESLSGLEQLAREDVGWRKLVAGQEHEFSRDGLLTIQANCLAASIKSPLIRRGLGIRRGYVWGQGVEIAARVAEDDDTTVNDVIQQFMDSPEFARTLGSAQAREEREMDLGNKGEFFILMARTADKAQVRPRLVPPAQVVDYITDADDATDVWFYQRRSVSNRVNLVTGQVEHVTRVEWHPVIDYAPPPGLRVPLIGGHVVRWDQPIQHCAVNTLTDAPYGLPDCYAAIDWARAYAEFLTQWAVLMRSLSRYAWRATAKGAAQAAKVKTALVNGTGRDPVTGEAKAGGIMVGPEGYGMEAIPKTGATIDSQSGKPLAGMAAAALDVPLTMLLADPGTTGARAVAETLDRPLELTIGGRRNVWADWHRALLQHALLVAAENGKLPGATIVQDGNRQRVILADGQPASIDVTWPPLDQADPAKVLESIKTADELEVLPRLLIAKLALEALGVEDPDEVLDELTDDQGRFLDPRIELAAAQVQAFQRGQGQAEEVYR